MMASLPRRRGALCLGADAPSLARLPRLAAGFWLLAAVGGGLINRLGTSVQAFLSPAAVIAIVGRLR
jgi:hypothetical protein